jgi:hypothetical protein
MKFAAVATALCLALVGQVSAAPLEDGVAKRAPYSGIATFFTPGLGSCGGTDNDNSMIVRRRSFFSFCFASVLTFFVCPIQVAMSQAMGNSYCGKTVSITNQKTGKTVKAKVTDRTFQIC